jgi:pyruvate dehydrogenase E2 component (dihydrolipoamide acetyltransferase)
MNNKILMPALSPTMTQGKLAKWIKKDGDFVKSGDVLLEIETDKATMEVESVDEGFLTILIQEGTNGVNVNTEIGFLSDSLETKSESTSALESALESVLESKSEEVNTNEKKDSLYKKHYSPLAKRMMEQGQINEDEVSGSGPMGRIIKDDITHLLNKRAKEIENKTKSTGLSCAIKTPEIKQNPEQNPEQYQAQPQDYIQVQDKGQINKKDITTQVSQQNLIEASNLRKTIAERLTFAKQNIPHFYLSIDCNIDKLLKLRTEINEQFKESKVSINDFIIKASGIALKNNSEVNASWENNHIRFYNSVDISVAVAIDGGLITPIIRDADKKSLREISSEVRVLAKKAKEGKLALNEFQGGNFTISNLGMYGIKEFSAIINPPQSCILAVGAGQKIPVVIDSEISIANIVNITMSCDHRIVDGVLGAKFLSEFKELIENPLKIVI